MAFYTETFYKHITNRKMKHWQGFGRLWQTQWFIKPLSCFGKALASQRRDVCNGMFLIAVP
jgi:hypothetical protein